MLGAMTLIGNVPYNDAAGMALYNVGGGPGASVSLDMYNTPFNSGIPQAKIKSVDDGAYSDHLTFWTKIPGAGANPLAERLRIASNGNVGIGTTMPVAKLEVSGSLKLSGSGNVLTFPDGSSQSTAALTGPQGLIGPTGPTGAAGLTGVIGPTGALGPIGPTGSTGVVGAAGPTGAVGALGPIGPTGSTGAVGAAGPAGAEGPVGPRRSRRASGSSGSHRRARNSRCSWRGRSGRSNRSGRARGSSGSHRRARNSRCSWRGRSGRSSRSGRASGSSGSDRRAGNSRCSWSGRSGWSSRSGRSNRSRGSNRNARTSGCNWSGRTDRSHRAARTSGCSRSRGSSRSPGSHRAARNSGCNGPGWYRRNRRDRRNQHGSARLYRIGDQFRYCQRGRSQFHDSPGRRRRRINRLFRGTTSQQRRHDRRQHLFPLLCSGQRACNAAGCHHRGPKSNPHRRQRQQLDIRQSSGRRLDIRPLGRSAARPRVSSG